MHGGGASILNPGRTFQTDDEREAVERQLAAVSEAVRVPSVSGAGWVF